MNIQTIQDWNAAAACTRCGCEMPTAFPVYSRQYIHGSVWLIPTFLNPDNGQRYLTRRINYDGGGFRQTSWDHPYHADIHPTSSPHRVFQATGTDTEAPPTVGDFTTTYSDGPVDVAAAIQTGIADIIAWVAANGHDAWDDGGPGFVHYDGAGVYFGDGGTPPDTYPMADVLLQRYRWRVPETLGYQQFRGSYAKITWDVARYENSGGLEPPDVTLVAEGLTTEWEGPGQIDAPDDESWFTGWHDFEDYMTQPWAAAATGLVAVNARWEYMRGSRLGNKPIPFGPAWPLP